VLAVPEHLEEALALDVLLEHRGPVYNARVVKRALFHAGITAVIVIAMCAAIAGAGVVQDTGKFGEGVGYALVFVFPGAFGVSWLRQTGRTTAASALIIAIVALLAGAFALGWRARHAHDFRAADRAPMIDEGGRLRHPTLGFSIESPGPTFHDAPAMAAVMRSSYGGDAIFYAYADAGPTAALLITVINGPLDLSKELDNLQRGMEASAAKRGTTAGTLEKTVTGREATMHVETGGAHSRLHAYQRETYTVIVMVMSRDAHALDSILTSLR
jgi:hypothetical protein